MCDLSALTVNLYTKFRVDYESTADILLFLVSKNTQAPFGISTSGFACSIAVCRSCSLYTFCTYFDCWSY